jgi:hypothetical protein
MAKKPNLLLMFFDFIYSHAMLQAADDDWRKTSLSTGVPATKEISFFHGAVSVSFSLH